VKVVMLHPVDQEHFHLVDNHNVLLVKQGHLRKLERLNALFVLLGIRVQTVSKRRVLKVPFLLMETTNVHPVHLVLSRNLEHPLVKNVLVDHFHSVEAERARLAQKCHRV